MDRIDYALNNNMNSLSLSTRKANKSMDIKLNKKEYKLHNIDRTFISLYGRDRIQCIQIFCSLEECELTETLSIPSSINEQIALFGIGVFSDCKMCNISVIVTLNEMDCSNTILCKECRQNKQCKECGRTFKKLFSLQRHILMRRCQKD